MKFYIYISDSKIDMLLAQIPREQKRKIATEFKFDLKVLSASRKSEVESEDNRFVRLETVIAFIREYGNVGSVDDPNEYVQDELSMRWGPYDAIDSPLVYFAGETEKTVVGLAGSKKHLIGNSMGESFICSYSYAPNILYYLRKELGLSLKWREKRVAKQLERFGEYQNKSDAYLSTIYSASRGASGPEQNLEFVAKRLLYGNSSRAWGEDSNRTVLLATPLYVAMVD